MEPQNIPRTTKEFLFWLLDRIKKRKQWWLMPFWILLVALGIALYLSGNGALLPAIYLAF
jgi:hypothetical protein